MVLREQKDANAFVARSSKDPSCHQVLLGSLSFWFGQILFMDDESCRFSSLQQKQQCRLCDKYEIVWVGLRK